jgi:hypothetical protein
VTLREPVVLTVQTPGHAPDTFAGQIAVLRGLVAHGLFPFRRAADAAQRALIADNLQPTLMALEVHLRVQEGYS